MGAIRVTKAFYLISVEEKTECSLILFLFLVGWACMFSLCCSSICLGRLSESLAHKLAPFGLLVKTIAPVGIYTGFAGHPEIRRKSQ
ncbi:hypothetical protein A8C56_18855 [Niabella ginsenosidivorans]|uniref:Uncharacterized protein n=1 Tax=Niabella ginsenosidivorans TaxID=1176587 RepID=A0A1A9I898_9BACT|nr:hypothetical protein A8C56_18855 [Niabella ginsenosidivorans]